MVPEFRNHPARRATREVQTGGIAIGGKNPLRVQSMLTSDTMDTAACVKETLGLVRAGCEIVRITAPTVKDARNLEAIRAALRHTYRIRRLVLTGTSAGLDVAALGGTDWRPAYRKAYPNAAPWITEARADHTTDLPRLTTRTLLLWGDHDDISPPAVGEHLATHLPNARLEIIKGGDHAFPNAKPVETATAIARHLA
jgi:pimeloyl-ACP methyl ester carboxylesterase